MTTFEEQVEQARKAVANANKLLGGLLLQCNHERTEPKSEYFSGGYDYTGYTKYWDECVVCCKRSNHSTVSTGRYG